MNHKTGGSQIASCAPAYHTAVKTQWSKMGDFYFEEIDDRY